MKLKDMPMLPLVMIALMFAVGAYVYPHLPAQIPVHWNAAGEIDRWAQSTVWNVFAEPLMALGFYVLFMVMPYFDPKRANIYKSKPVYFLVLDAVTALIMLMFFGGLAAAFNSSVPVDRLALAGIGLMLMVLGNYMGRVKRNWTMGVRFSWTLSDDTVWAKTNRLGGRLFFGAGALTFAGAFTPPPWGITIMLVCVVAILPITYLYSMRLYKSRHPDQPNPSEPTIEDQLRAE
ncbi:MAG: SdpI family protein [Coriobacteriia bacterium]|nr:SdpI family protein [Coriobacteriia bacterium]